MIEEEDNKYFTPDIRDMRVGYECEMKMYGRDIWMETIFCTPDFTSVLNKNENIYSVPDTLRVPYLTKEKIESEEWKIINTEGINPGQIEGRYAFSKGNYFLIYDTSTKTIEILYRDPSIAEDTGWGVSRMPEHFRFQCDCKDINTFRYIMKLLKI